MSFAHLHVHTEFSLLDGSNKIKEYVSRVKELGMNSAAITDHGVMYGVIDFYREAKKQGINPILGCEVYVAPNSRFDREITGGDDRYYHLVLLAENEEGYANLTKIAKDTHQSVSVLSKLIRQKTGDTFKELLQQRRFETAAHLLMETDLAVEEIALDVGYENLSYFFRQFKSRYGVTPRAYRMMNSRDAGNLYEK